MIFASAVAANPHSSPELLTRLAAVGIEQVLEACAANPNTPTPELIILAGAGAGWRTRRAVAANPSLPGEQVAVLLGDPHPFVAEKALTNPNVSPALLAHLLVEGTQAQRSAAAANPTIDVDTLHQYVASNDEPRQVGAAENPNMDADTLKRLARSNSSPLRVAVAGNRNTPHDTLIGLLHDPQSPVSRAAAANPNLPAPTLRLLLASEDALTWTAARRNIAARLAEPYRLRPDATADLAAEWLAHPYTGSSGDGSGFTLLAKPDTVDDDLRIAAICTVNDDGVRTGHILAYGPGWEADLAAFRSRFGAQYLPDTKPPAPRLAPRRRAPRDVIVSARSRQ